MLWLIDTLRRFANWLEVRREPQVYATLLAFEMARDSHTIQLAALKAEIEKIQKHIEILNLRVGLTRSTQATFGRKLNG